MRFRVGIKYKTAREIKESAAFGEGVNFQAALVDNLPSSFIIKVAALRGGALVCRFDNKRITHGTEETG